MEKKLNLKELIKDSGIKQKKFCEVLELDSKTWTKRIEEPNKLTIEETEKLANLLQVTPEALLKLIIA